MSSSQNRVASSSASSSWLRGLHTVLTRRMRIERRGLQLRIVAEGPVRPASTRGRPTAGRRRDALPPMSVTTLAQAHVELKAILDAEHDARRRRPTLALLERALDKDVESGIDQIPACVLRHAAEALDLLQDECFSPGIVELRRRVALVLRRRHAGLFLQEAADAGGRHPDFVDSLTEFVALDGNWDEPPRRTQRAS
jgi:hypothetical protein